MGQRDVWLCVLDDHHARLLRGKQRRSRRLHLDVVESHENQWEELEHAGRGPQSGKEGHGDADLKHRRAEFLLRYARDAVRWLERKLPEHDIESVDVFAPPRLLGAFRSACSAALSKRTRAHRGDLGCMSPGALEKHPAISALFKPAGSR